MVGGDLPKLPPLSPRDAVWGGPLRSRNGHVAGGLAWDPTISVGAFSAEGVRDTQARSYHPEARSSFASHYPVPSPVRRDSKVSPATASHHLVVAHFAGSHRPSPLILLFCVVPAASAPCHSNTHVDPNEMSAASATKDLPTEPAVMPAPKHCESNLAHVAVAAVAVRHPVCPPLPGGGARGDPRGRRVRGAWPGGTCIRT
mmetsp:Transcript_47677/g.93109  ORF Transcript_47677/g.93109 Transcript_47677/m.93109 type:complete len:201 (-) Transcript_47677:116-718(-)